MVTTDSKLASYLSKSQVALHNYPILVPVIILLLSIAVFGIWGGGNFFSPRNLSIILQQVSIVGILAAGQSMVILTAGIDLSNAAILSLTSVVMGFLAVMTGVPVYIAIPIGFAAGITAGTLNGMLVTRIKLPPFIVTLGTWSIFGALSRFFSSSQSLRNQDVEAEASPLLWFGERFSLGEATITYGVILMFAVFIVIWYILNKTAFGRHIYAVGDDREAAELSGVRTSRILLLVYIGAGAICALAAWASIGRVGAVSSFNFADANLQSITAVVIGGVSLFGGRGSILGVLFGAITVGVFESGLRIAGVHVLWQTFAIGWLIIIAVGIDQWIRRVAR